MKTASNALDHNAALIAERGPGLYVDLEIGCGARCSSGKHVLHVGLGAAGVGSMWVESSEAERSDPKFAALPVQSCHDFGLAPLIPGMKCRCCECSG